MARLSREARRDQLLAIGRGVIEDVTLDQVSTDEIADRAGISRGLLFHYFPTKHDFLVAIARDFADDLLVATAPVDVDDPLVALRGGIVRYLDFMQDNQRAYQSLVRAAAGGREDMQALFDETRDAQATRMLEGAGIPPTSASARQRWAIRGFVALVEEVTMLWLDEGGTSRDEVVDLVVGMAGGLLQHLDPQETG